MVNLILRKRPLSSREKDSRASVEAEWSRSRERSRETLLRSPEGGASWDQRHRDRSHGHLHAAPGPGSHGAASVEWDRSHRCASMVTLSFCMVY